MQAKEIMELMESLRDDVQRRNLMRFFKTGEGQYGYGDEFLGLKMPQTREIVKASVDLPLEEIPQLLVSPWHEVRMCGFLLLVYRFERLCRKSVALRFDSIRQRDLILETYLRYSRYANNWDLVDMTAPKILGAWVLLPTFICGWHGKEAVSGEEPALYLNEKVELLDFLAFSDCLWEQRMSMVFTWKTSQKGEAWWCHRYAQIHLHHTHDLMHKAVGWMLREMGARCDVELLRSFLSAPDGPDGPPRARTMPRTALRYAIEKLPERERQYWMKQV